LVSFLVSLSVIVHRFVPGGLWMLALPLCTALSTLPTTLRSAGVALSVNTHPCVCTFPIPVNVVPPQQNLYCPVCEFHSSIVEGLESSCTATSNVLTVKLHVAVLPDVSVAVQVTVVTPTLKHPPDGGTHATVTPGQLSLATGFGNVTVVQPDPEHTFWSVIAVTFEGQVIEGGCVSLTVTVNVQLAVLADESDTLQVTVVVPFGKNDPEAGEHTGAPTPGQLSETVGAG
jgi:hypothetical protein